MIPSVLRVARCALAPLLPLALVVAAAPRDVRAQFAIDKTESVINLGDPSARTGVLRIRNEGDKRAQATIKVEDWDRAEDGSNRFYTAGTHPHSCARALTVFPLALNLAPGESQTVRYTYAPDTTPAAVRPQECWSVVLVESVMPRTESGGRTLFYALRTGMKLYVEPSGLVADGQVSDVAVHPVPRDSTGRAGAREAEVVFQNTGTRHVIANGHLEFRRPDNTTAATVPLPPAYALPGASARVKAKLPPLAPGRYVVLAVMDYGGSELAAAQLEQDLR